MTNKYLDFILEIRHLIDTHQKAMESTGLTSLIPAIELNKDELKFIDKGMTELTTQKED